MPGRDERARVGTLVVIAGDWTSKDCSPNATCSSSTTVGDGGSRMTPRKRLVTFTGRGDRGRGGGRDGRTA